MKANHMTPLREQGRLLVQEATKKLITPDVIADSPRESKRESVIVLKKGEETMSYATPRGNKKTFQKYGQSEVRFLKQLKYWIGRGKYGIKHEGQIWIRNTQEQWADQLGVSKMTISRIVKSLLSKGKIKTARLSRYKYDKTGYYTIVEESLVNTVEKTIKVNQNVVTNIQENKNNKSNKSGKILPPKEEAVVREIPKTTTAQDMLKFWNETLGKNERISKELAKFLVAAMKFRFKTLEIWKKFVRAIKDSMYLIQSNFKLFLRWVLKFSSIDRIMNGEFGCKKQDYTDEQEKEEREIKELYETVDAINALEEDAKFTNIRRMILAKTSVWQYKAWFHCCQISESNGKVYLQVSSHFSRDYIQTHFRDIVDQYFEEGVKCQN